MEPYGEQKTLRWMRRSRFVAREFANDKRLDTFSPATGAHTANLLPIQYLWPKQQAMEMENKGGYKVVMGCLDVKDAFLQVEQRNPILVSLQNQPFVILRNLPGQRMGARQWFQHLRGHLRDAYDFEFCSEQPCLAKNQHATILIHVDDIMFVGKKSFWENTCLKGMSHE